MAATPILESIIPSSNSFEPLLPYIPTHSKYYEHSCNHLNLFGALAPFHSGSVNSKDKYFIEFLNNYQKPEFKVELINIGNVWKLLGSFSEMLSPELEIVYDDLSKDYLSKDDLPFVVRAITVTNMDNPKFESFCNPAFTINLDSFTDKLIHYLINSLILNLNCDSRANIEKSVSFSIKQGFIAHFKEIVHTEGNSIPEYQFLALWLFNRLIEGKSKLPSTTFVDEVVDQLYSEEMTQQLETKEYTNLAFAEFIKEQDFTQKDLLVLTLPEKSIDDKMGLLKTLKSQILILTQNTRLNHQYQEELGFKSVNILGHDSLLILKNY